MHRGHLHQTAPELRVPIWIEGSGGAMASPLRLADLGAGYKVIFAF